LSVLGHKRVITMLNAGKRKASSTISSWRLEQIILSCTIISQATKESTIICKANYLNNNRLSFSKK